MMQAMQALISSPIFGAKYLGKGYRLAILDAGMSYLDLTLDRHQEVTRWFSASIADIGLINTLAQSQHSDFDQAGWEPLQSTEEMKPYEIASKASGSPRKRRCQRPHSTLRETSAKKMRQKHSRRFSLLFVHICWYSSLRKA